jgi:LuxR family transcriptional regulator, maltose regulon positive regulatory protein
MLIKKPNDTFIKHSLLAKINEVSHIPILLLQGPAGCGKSLWYKEFSRIHAIMGVWGWIPKDSSDLNDLYKQWFHSLVTPLKRINPMCALDYAITPNSLTLADIIALCQYSDKKINLILDDFHTINPDALTHLMETFSQLHCENVSIVLIGRGHLNLKTSRLIAQEAVAEIGSESFCLTQTETEQFLLARYGITFSAKALQEVFNYTKGWLTGIDFVAKTCLLQSFDSKKMESFDLTNSLVAEYLIEQVMQPLPEHLRTFIMYSALLDDLDPYACDCIFSTTDSILILESLVKIHCFIVKEHHTNIYTMHPMLKQTLFSYLQMHHPDKFIQLNRAASEFYWTKDLRKALKHMLHMGKPELLCQNPQEALESMMKNSDFRVLRIFVDAILPEDAKNNLNLCVFYTWALFHLGYEARTEVMLNSARTLWHLENTDQPPEQSTQDGLWPYLEYLESCFLRIQGKQQDALARAKQAMLYTPESNMFLRCSLHLLVGIAYFQKGDFTSAIGALEEAMKLGELSSHYLAYFGAAYTLNEVYLIHGKLASALTLCKKTLRLQSTHGRSCGPAYGYAHIAWGKYLCATGDFDGAEQPLQAGIHLGKLGNNIRILNYGYAGLSVIRSHQKHFEEALNLLDLAEQAGLQNQMHWAIDLDHLGAMKARILLRLKKMPQAVAQIQVSDTINLSNSATHWDVAISTLLLLFHQGSTDETVAMANHMLLITIKEARIGHELVLHVLLANASPTVKERSHHLIIAMNISKATGILRPFLEYPESLLNTTNISAPPLQGFHQYLLQLTQQSMPSFQMELSPILSPREMQVLAHLKEGLSNAEISDLLYIAPSTIKTHIKNICVKLEVNNRTKAIAKATSMGILN